MPRYPKIVERNGKRYFYRFSVHQRVQHVMLFSCVITLALTGFPLRFADKPWAADMYALFGGIEIAPKIHRTVGTILLGLFIYHTCYFLSLFYNNRVKKLKAQGNLTPGNAVREFLSMDMIPNKRDAYDIVDTFKYLLYWTNRKPRYERMSWKEKFDYFAPYWGIPVLGPAGVLLWQRDFFSHYIPGIVINAAYIMHTDEALLAAIFLFGVHWYNVHYSPEKFPMATVFLTGYLSEDEMFHEHYAEYTRVMNEEGLEKEAKPQH